MQVGCRAAAAALRAAFLWLGALCCTAALGATLRTDLELGGQWKVNSTARVLSGLAPMYPGHYDLAQTEAWKDHSAAMQAGWTQLRAGRVAAMSAWRDEEISRTCPVGKTLLYPFSGPDFFNAYWLFPECDTFVMFGLEHIGQVPDIDSLNERELTRLLSDVRAATSDLFNRNYFITENMTRQLYTAQLRGVLPLIMISMALSGAEILRMGPQELTPGQAPSEGLVGDAADPPANAEGAPKMASLRKPRGIVIDFRAPNSPAVKHLVYFTVDATDGSLARYPEFLAYLRRLGPTTTLLKSASYLLHGREFSRLRKALLDVSQFLVQDDSGLPYKMLVSGGWQMRLHGTYTTPIPPFERAYQPNLRAAYQAQHPGPLPFDFGYAFHDRRDERANVMVGRKVAQPRSLAALSRPVRPRLKYAAPRR